MACNPLEAAKSVKARHGGISQDSYRSLEKAKDASRFRNAVAEVKNRLTDRHILLIPR